ncbi:ssrAB-activated protein [Cronobacter sakazakii]|uniref:SsrAB-activated protein n=4 Tax=Cronobacter sakazakii TaxID=28141 RepID=A0A853H6V2_CROSK|nr:SrfA family protein [Cronobacter sakazakii]AKE96134.1 putative ssrAB activated protein [Cronobacter sakazakii]AXW97671.2 ssrAB-activated protein [Cronobacter sakazakii]EGT4266108.1 ssrAB-activated protein [Cronobacter sakazakii]EGT4286096.1 ssrAB-activated protein [Cronobacter sakazakii]EGT4291748.1 ssrAB-activated protein [Cronobacter sakazakii]
MAKILLRSGDLDDFQSVGENGQAVFESALQIRETLRLRKQPLVELLAIPQLNEEGDRVDWYSPVSGKVMGWASASREERERALRFLESALSSARALSKRCLESEKTAQQLFGALLAKAVQFPGANFLYLVDGKPVITFWGFVNLNQGARDDVLECLREAEPIEPEIIMTPQEEPEPEPTPLMMTEPDAPLLATPPVTPAPVAPAPAAPVHASAAALAAYAAEAEATAPPEETAPAPVKAPTPARRSRVPLWTWPLAAAVVMGAVAASVTWYLLQQKETAAPTVSVAQIKAQEIAPAPVKSVDAPAAPVVPVAPTTSLPLAEAKVTPPAPVVEEKPVAAPAPVDKNALVMDANQVKAGTTRFLNGTWRLSIGSPDPITGKATSMRVEMKNNKGTARVTLGDNVVCKAELFSGLHQTGELMIKTRGKARCSDGSRYPMPEIACKAGPNDVAECTGRYDEKTVLPLTMKKVSA